MHHAPQKPGDDTLFMLVIVGLLAVVTAGMVLAGPGLAQLGGMLR